MQTETMNSVQEIDTMSNISWATEKSMISNIEKARNCGLPPRSPPRSPSSQTTKYPIKTLCFSKKSLTMPTKEEYSILLTCGLGARKWQVSLDSDEEAFQSAIYKIYPRLTSVTSYTLWNIKKDKTFEKLPTKVNTPSRIRAYLGNQFSGCLIIMPSEEIQLVSEMIEKNGINNRSTKVAESREPQPTQLRHLTDQVMDSKIYSESGLSSLQISQHGPVSLKRDHTGAGSTYPSFSSSQDTQREQPNKHQSNNRSLHRLFCLVCGKVPKQPNATPFYEVETATLPTANAENNFTSLSKKLREVIKISDAQRNQLVPSKDVCKKCFRSLVDMEFMENQIRKVKEEMMGNFLATATKVSKMTGVIVPPNNNLGENTYTTTSNTIRPSTSTVSLQPTHNLDEARNTHRQNMNGISHRPIQFPASSIARSVNSMTSSYSWEMGPQPQRQTTEQIRQIEGRQPTDNVLFGLSKQQIPSAYDNLMVNLTQEEGRRMLQETRGRRMGPQNPHTLPSRSASHDPAGYRHDLMDQQNARYPEIPSVPSSNNGDIGTSNASESYQIYRRARSSPPRLTDIPPNFISQINRRMEAYQIECNKGAPVNLSSNSSSGNEAHSNSTMTMAAVSAERCTDWVKDSRICENIKNHYSIKDVEKTETTDQPKRKEKGDGFVGGQSSGDDSTAASCGSTPPTAEGSDDSKNSSDTDSPDNDTSGTLQKDNRDNEKEQHKRVHYQDHKLSAKNIKQHQKINRRLQRSPMKLVQKKSTEFQKPRKSKKDKKPKHHNNETVVENDASKNNGNGASDSNGTSDSNGEGNSSNGNGAIDQWTRSSSNTPSPPTSFGSVGSNDNSSTDPSSSSTDANQAMTSHFPKPFWKKRYCEDTNESSTQQANDNIQSSITNNEAEPTGSQSEKQSAKSEDSDTTKSSSPGVEEMHQTIPAKRRKLEKLQHETSSYIGNTINQIPEETDLNEEINTRRRKGIKDNSSNSSSPRLPTPNDNSTAISTDSGHESRSSD